MPPAKILAASLEIFVIFAAVSALHRVVAFDALAGGSLKLLSDDGMRTLLVGLLSDVWIAYLAALTALMTSGVLVLIGYPSIGRLVRVAMLIGLGAVTEFTANAGTSAAAPAGMAAGVIGALILLGLVLLAVDPFGSVKTGKLAAIFIVMTVAGVGAHHENIALRDGLPEALKVNLLERLYMNAGW